MEEEKILDIRIEPKSLRISKSYRKESECADSQNDNDNKLFIKVIKNKDDYKAYDKTPISPYCNDFIYSYKINTQADKVRYNSMRESKIDDSKRNSNSLIHYESHHDMLHNNTMKKQGSQIRILAQIESHQEIPPTSLAIDLFETK